MVTSISIPPTTAAAALPCPRIEAWDAKVQGTRMSFVARLRTVDGVQGATNGATGDSAFWDPV
ncbi:MAG TPA: hypothetical protein VME70_00235 [Mycobacteriales bacterium]|nr:hypothetical protein [Mycobacteriales bacterium]